MPRRELALWVSVLLVVVLLTGSVAAVGIAIAFRGLALLLLLVAMASALAALWIAAGRPRAWGGEPDADERRWWRGGAASPHH